MKEQLFKRLQEALYIRDMRQIDLAEKTGISKSKINMYVKGYHAPKHEAVYLLAKALGVQEAWLMGYDVPMEEEEPVSDFTPDEVQCIQKLRSLDQHGRQVVSFLLDAEYNRVQDILAASRGEAVGESGTIAVPLILDALSKKTVATIPIQAEGEIKKGEADLFAIPVTRDTMAPLIMPGDRIIVREQSDVNDGDIAVVLLDGVQVVCKQVFKDGDNIRLVPLNKKYDEVIIHKEDIRKKKFEIIGRVVKNIQAG